MSLELRSLSTEKTTSSHGRTLEAINSGSLQRIADAVEKMSGSYSSLIVDRDYYKNEYERSQQRIATLKKSNAALRGVIGRMKRKGGAS